MRDLTIDAVGKVPGGEYDRVEVDGILTVEGDMTARRIEVDGVMTARGDLTARECLEVDGVLTAEGSVYGGTIEIDGVATVEGNMKGKDISVDGSFVIRGEKLEADSVSGDGVITVTGEVNADTVEIEGVLRANMIFGDRVTIQGHRHASFWKWLSKQAHVSPEEPLKINLIEATQVEIGDLAVAEISAQRVILHSGCTVDKVYCTERLVIEDDARVGEISGSAQVSYD